MPPSILNLLKSAGLCAIARDEAVEILSQAFRNDAFHRFVLLSWNGSEDAGLTDLSLNRVFFTELLTQLAKEGAVCVSIPGSPVVMVCNLVTVGGTNSTPAANEYVLPKALREMEAKSNAELVRLFGPGRAVLHIYLVGKDNRPRSYAGDQVRGADVLIQGMKAAALRQWPLYLEATSPHSRDIAKALGFKVASEVKVGVGQVDKYGRPNDGGAGVSLWVATFEHGTDLCKYIEARSDPGPKL